MTSKKEKADFVKPAAEEKKITKLEATIKALEKENKELKEKSAKLLAQKEELQNKLLLANKDLMIALSGGSF